MECDKNSQTTFGRLADRLFVYWKDKRQQTGSTYTKINTKCVYPLCILYRSDASVNRICLLLTRSKISLWKGNGKTSCEICRETSLRGVDLRDIYWFIRPCNVCESWSCMQCVWRMNEQTGASSGWLVKRVGREEGKPRARQDGKVNIMCPLLAVPNAVLFSGNVLHVTWCG